MIKRGQQPIVSLLAGLYELLLLLDALSSDQKSITWATGKINGNMWSAGLHIKLSIIEFKGYDLLAS